jgi:four helix bundle protein
MAVGLLGLRIYQLAEALADQVWDEVITWKPFPRDTVGRQFVAAADSIGANIAEGYGRFHYRDMRQFQLIARSSLEETGHWLRRAKRRNLIGEKRYDALARLLGDLAPQLNAYIRSLDRRATERSPRAKRPSPNP